MENATWQLLPGEPRLVRQLAAELGLSQTAAAVLVRRGYDGAATAGAFLEGALPGHDPFVSARKRPPGKSPRPPRALRAKSSRSITLKRR